MTGDYLVAFDPPEDGDGWLTLTTREMHYTEISKELEKQAKSYELEKRYAYAKVARDLANTINSNNTKIN